MHRPHDKRMHDATHHADLIVSLCILRPAGTARYLPLVMELAFSLLTAAPLLADRNSLNAQYLSCGSVSVTAAEGPIGSNAKPVSRFSWDWGDGTVADSFFPAIHLYFRNGDFHVVVTAHLTDGSTLSDSVDLQVANAEDPLCRYSVRLYPETVLLRAGSTSAPLVLDVRDPSGAPVSLADKTISYSSSNPGLISVNGSGVVSSTGFGEAQVSVTVSGLPRPGTSLVTAGEFRLEPALILLTPGDSAQITIRMIKADGTPAAGNTVRFFGGNAVASVTDSGLVTALQPVKDPSSIPLIGAYAAPPTCVYCYSHNGVLVRVTAAPFGLTLRDYPGTHVSFRIADQVASLPFGSLMTDLQGPAVTDAIYTIEQKLTGVTPNRGDLQFLVMDPGLDADGTAVCGLSGNPVRLGIAMDTVVTRPGSCLGGSDYLHWGVIAHELGHNFLSLNQRSFSDVVGNLPNRTTFIEGIATFLGFCSLEEIIANPGAYSLKPQTVLSLRRDDVAGTPANDRRFFFPELASYEATPNYPSGLTADVLDAILIQLYDEFGSRFAYRFLSAFVPSNEPQEIRLATDGQRLAFWAAACSAAGGVDLKDRFQTKWAFPLDPVFYDSILPRVRALVERREPGRLPVSRSPRNRIPRPVGSRR